tara:strand:- start:409 stop:582 length:174 start_codon:yes stop_codon:yes gene_type:complete
LQLDLPLAANSAVNVTILKYFYLKIYNKKFKIMVGARLGRSQGAFSQVVPQTERKIV